MKIGKNVEPERSLNYILDFGSYKDMTIKNIIDMNSAYMNWILSEKIIKLNKVADKYFRDSLWDYNENKNDLPF